MISEATTKQDFMSAFEKVLRPSNYINGSWVSEGKSQFEVKDKFTQAPIAEVFNATEAQMEEAIASSVTAFEELKTWSAGKRADALQSIRDLLAERSEAFSQLIAAEAGKPIGYARAEISRCLNTLDVAISEAIRFSGEIVPMDYSTGQGKTAITKRFPIGPIACISPFNFPLNLALHKIAPAIAAGCTLVLKPAPQSPLSALAFAGLVDEAQCLPAGAISVLMADIPEAEKLVRDDRMKMLSFTGSPSIGWHLKNIVGKKKVALELGGNAAVIIDEGVELESAAKTVANGAFLYAGQICISTQRIYVHTSVYNKFESLLTEAVKQINTGDPRDEKNTVGPLIAPIHLKRVSDWVEEARSAGAKVLTGGKVLSEQNVTYAPTLLSHTNNSMKVCSEEVFGPVAILERVDSFEDAIERTNDSVFGLQAGVFTNRLDHMKLAFETLEVGGVIMNNVPGFRIDNMPYGGIKDSGLGREGIRYAMEEMTEPRLLVY